MQKTYKFYIRGMHCKSCELMTESELKEFPFITNVKARLRSNLVEISGDFGDNSPENIAKQLNTVLIKHRYSLLVEKIPQEKKQDDVIWKAIPIGLGFIVLFFMLQKSSILNIGIGGQTTPVTSFIIGLIASVSSCLAIVGGLVLSLSAKVSQDNTSDTRTFLLFHAGRLVSFAVLGGVLGIIGGAIGINFAFTAILGIFASLVMLFLGLNLVGIFSKNKITLHSGFFNFFKRIEHKTFTPLIIGFGTFFLPCGFTQSMQLVALSSGSFMSGAFIMFAFALGTLPMLVLLSFGSASFAHSKHAPLFFKSAGIVVIGFGIFSLLAGLAGLGIINPLFNI